MLGEGGGGLQDVVPHHYRPAKLQRRGVSLRNLVHVIYNDDDISVKLSYRGAFHLL